MLTLEKEHKTFEGHTKYFSHQSDVTKTPMRFSAFIPQKEIHNCLIWLSGLTCNEENFISKAGAQKLLSKTDTMILCPDTSPRGLDLENEHESYDFGSGAGFYLNATMPGYREHYKMYDYIVDELLPMVRSKFDVKKFSISGHSMGGHGALVLGLREPHLFESVSAFSPLVNPTKCPWGQKAFEGYLGDDVEAWKKYDATELVKDNKHPAEVLIDQGLADEFLHEQLLTKNFEEACREYGQKVKVNYREGHDHSYYFISTYIESHIDYHLRFLNCQ